MRTYQAVIAVAAVMVLSSCAAARAVRRVPLDPALPLRVELTGYGLGADAAEARTRALEQAAVLSALAADAADFAVVVRRRGTTALTAIVPEGALKAASAGALKHDLRPASPVAVPAEARAAALDAGERSFSAQIVRTIAAPAPDEKRRVVAAKGRGRAGNLDDQTGDALRRMAADAVAAAVDDGAAPGDRFERISARLKTWSLVTRLRPDGVHAEGVFEVTIAERAPLPAAERAPVLFEAWREAVASANGLSNDAFALYDAAAAAGLGAAEHAEFGTFAARNRRFDRAIPALERACGAEPGSIAYREALTGAYRAKGDEAGYKKSAAILEKLQLGDRDVRDDSSSGERRIGPGGEEDDGVR